MCVRPLTADTLTDTTSRHVGSLKSQLAAPHVPWISCDCCTLVFFFCIFPFCTSVCAHIRQARQELRRMCDILRKRRPSLTTSDTNKDRRLFPALYLGWSVISEAIISLRFVFFVISLTWLRVIQRVSNEAANLSPLLTDFNVHVPRLQHSSHSDQKKKKRRGRQLGWNNWRSGCHGVCLCGREACSLLFEDVRWENVPTVSHCDGLTHCKATHLLTYRKWGRVHKTSHKCIIFQPVFFFFCLFVINL